MRRNPTHQSERPVPSLSLTQSKENRQPNERYARASLPSEQRGISAQRTVRPAPARPARNRPRPLHAPRDRDPSTQRTVGRAPARPGAPTPESRPYTLGSHTLARGTSASAASTS